MTDTTDAAAYTDPCPKGGMSWGKVHNCYPPKVLPTDAAALATARATVLDECAKLIVDKGESGAFSAALDAYIELATAIARRNALPKHSGIGWIETMRSEADEAVAAAIAKVMG